MRIESARAPSFTAFSEALTDVARELAQAIVRDGEGATKFIEVRVEQAATEHEARQIGYAVATFTAGQNRVFRFRSKSWTNTCCGR